MIQNIDVLILCGGKGKRLKKISGRIPKPMVCIGQRPFLDIIIEALRGEGFKRFILGIGYQAAFIKKYYKEHKIPGIEIVFSQENKPLGTGGAVKNAKRLIKSKAFLVLNGDSFSKFDVKKFISFFGRKKAESLILLRRVKNSRDFGSITIDGGAEITSFSEKTLRHRQGLINGGVYLFGKSVFSKMPRKTRFSLEYDFFPKRVGHGMYGYKDPGFFIDIGTPERYFAAQKYFLKSNRNQ